MDTFMNFDYLKLYSYNFETYQLQNYIHTYTLKKRIKNMFLVICYL